VGTVRSQHLGEGENSGADPVLIYTAGDTGVTVIKGAALGTLGVAGGWPAAAVLYCEFSGGAIVPIMGLVSPNYPYGTTIFCWIVLPPGAQVYLVGDGANTWGASIDGAVLQDT